MVRARPESDWPALPLADWQQSQATLHMWMQIVGKLRLALAAPVNHWWHVPLYVTARGMTTSLIPTVAGGLQVDFDFFDHIVTVTAGGGRQRRFTLPGRSVAGFYREFCSTLVALGVRFAPWPVPVEVADPIPFPKDSRNAYDAAAVRRFWRLLVQAERLLGEFRGRFLGKSSPVHFFWGSFDLAVSRFSGRLAPPHPGVPGVSNRITREAYSHEVSSAGFWPGGGDIEEPAFYAYAYPEPDGFAEHRLRTPGAYYSDTLKEFVLPLDAVRGAAEPDRAVLEFLQSTYEAAAVRGGWPRPLLER